ncbi:MAG: protein phosphatase 2C domain-containing protein, partial [Dehalococcoidia bacterium]|nr:protein phosphatase 2C domain-containing protein [Dehalococcoidia bacterium]
QALREAVETASARVREAAREGQHSAMATTLVAAIVDEKRAWIVSIGDSRAYLHHAGVLRQLTEDDSWVADQVRANLLTEEQARRSPHRNIITRAIGASDVPAVEPLEVLLAAGDTLLLCSDGLHAVIDDKDIATLLAADSAEETAAALIDAANVAGGPDNIAVALYRAPMANRR